MMYLVEMFVLVLYCFQTSNAISEVAGAGSPRGGKWAMGRAEAMQQRISIQMRGGWRKMEGI